MNWSGVIFDMDGLMIDSEPIALEAWRALAAEYDREVPTELYQQVVTRAVRGYRCSHPLLPQQLQQLNQTFGRLDLRTHQHGAPGPIFLEQLICFDG